MTREGGSEIAQPHGELRLAASRLREGIALLRDDRIHWASPRLEELLVAPASPSLMGRDLVDLLGVDSVWMADARSGRRMRWSGTGSPLAVECAGTVLPEAGEGNEIWIFDEITHEHGSQTRGSAIDELDRELEELRKQARDRVRQRDDLIALLSHELRTPLTVIAGYSKLLLSGQVGELSPEQQRCLQQSSLGCDRLNAFVSDLLETSCEHPEGFPIDPRPSDLGAAIERVVEFHRPLLEERNLSVAVDLRRVLPAVSCDEMRIEQVLTNLLGNAIKYTKAGSRIDLKMDEVIDDAGDRMIEVSVVDDGPGIAAPDRDRIFEAFVRSDAGDGMSGVGLGLAICRQIVDAHRGEISVRDERGRGSRFAFRLPVTCDANMAENL